MWLIQGRETFYVRKGGGNWRDMEASRHTGTLIPWAEDKQLHVATRTKSVRVKPSDAQHTPINDNILTSELCTLSRSLRATRG